MDKIQIGVIGCNGMGWSNVVSMLKREDVICIGICDIDQNVLSKRSQDYQSFRNNVPDLYTDYREMLQREDLDAVIIGTPDHWHCLPMIEAV